MGLSGAQIGPDEVLAWTGERELTHFTRDGARSSFTVRYPALASRIGPAGVWIADPHGCVQRYSTAGHYEHVSLPQIGLVEGEAAGLSADGRWLAVLYDEIVHVLEHGEERPWEFPNRRWGGWRELDVDLSPDGQHVVVRYQTFPYRSGPGSLGDRSEGVVVCAQDGALRFHHRATELAADFELALGPRWVAIHEHAAVQIYELVTMAPVHRLDVTGVRCMGFEGARLGVLHDGGLAIVDLERQRAAQLALPEQFDGLVLCEDDAVVIHPELGAWWIPLASLLFTALPAG